MSNAFPLLLRALNRSLRIGLMPVLLSIFVVSLTGGEEGAAAGENPEKKDGWRKLFDGKTLAGWEVTKFAGHGEVKAESGKLILGRGVNLTGVTWTNDYPKINYEIRLKAKRVEGYDFFCGLTFPVKDSHCSLIIGGWGGGVYGLSNIDGYDASENETTEYMPFKTGKWYKVRLKVTEERIQAWLDGEKKLVDVPLEDRKFSVRADIAQARPLGFSAWRTTAALKEIRIRCLDE